MYFVHKITVVLCLLTLLKAYPQNGIYIGLNGSLGAAFTKIQNKSGASQAYLQQRNFISLLSSGFGVGKDLKDDKFAVQASVLYLRYVRSFADPYQYSYNSQTITSTFKDKMSGLGISAGIAKLFKLNDKTIPYIQGNFQFSFFKNFPSRLTYSRNSYSSSLIHEHPQRLGLGIVPEIGIRLKTGLRSTWVFSFMHHMGLTDVLYGEFISRDNQDIKTYNSYESKNSYNAFSVRYQHHLNFEKKSKPEMARQPEFPKERTVRQPQSKEVKYDKNGVPKILKNRVVEKQKSIEVNTTEIEFHVWDNGKEEDNDIISLYINGQWVLENYTLSREKKTIRVTINPNEKNFLILYAINEGKFPPNTAAISVSDGSKENILELSSDMKKCGALNFTYKP
ncbi:MAG: hypothetical protein NZ529_06285 [Cytophagaceae bacterium]|nr:hypothetical protein [Cytophagaceae bacterium]MDW8456387.1 hypothetical protein [Cytophagaceae bacterium]